MTVPIQSNKSTNNRVNTIISISAENIPVQSNFMNIGSTDGGVPNTPLNCVIPIGIPIIVVRTIPISNAPLTFRTNNIDVSIIPINPNRAPFAK